LASSTNKRVVAVRFDREPIRGYITFPSCLRESAVEVLTAEGTLAEVPYADIKYVGFVKMWEQPPGEEMRKSFISRPKGGGVWVRFLFRDGDSMEALLSGDLMEWPAQGYLATPPDSARNTQRLFVPKAALQACAALGIIGSARRESRKREPAAGQLKMFD
jgi:hypothetical protein